MSLPIRSVRFVALVQVRACDRCVPFPNETRHWFSAPNATASPQPRFSLFHLKRAEPRLPHQTSAAQIVALGTQLASRRPAIGFPWSMQMFGLWAKQGTPTARMNGGSPYAALEAPTRGAAKTLITLIRAGEASTSAAEVGQCRLRDGREPMIA
jgi:hypothetical protein